MYVCRHPTVILTLSDYPHFALHIKFLLGPTLFLLCAQIISDDNTIYIPCAILELSGTIPKSAEKVGFLLCAGTIPESYRFLLCTEHIYNCPVQNQSRNENPGTRINLFVMPLVRPNMWSPSGKTDRPQLCLCKEMVFLF